MQLNSLMSNLLPGAIAVIVIGAAGYVFGAQSKQRELDQLHEQLKEYHALGQRVSELGSAIETSMNKHNKELVDAYARDLGKLRTDFGNAQTGLSAATQELKRQGHAVMASAGDLGTAIAKLPMGSPEREAKIAEVVAIVSDLDKRRQLCAVTALAPTQLAPLKMSFALDTP